MFNLASYYEQGIGTKPNKQKAFNLYKLSAKDGFMPACFSLARCYQLGIGVSKSLGAAIKNYNICIENGYFANECALKIYYCHLEMEGYPSA
ncbi:MAG: tetratricopeptide repeat protein [Parachlamydiaceae bacterium]